MASRSWEITSATDVVVDDADVDSEDLPTIDGLRIVGPVHHSADDSSCMIMSSSQDEHHAATGSKRWVMLGSNAVCSMTGLASDIDYLTSTAQNLVDDHRYVYDGASHAQSPSLPAGQLVQILTYVLQRETVFNDQRPLGVQVLLVGRDKPNIYNSASTGGDGRGKKKKNLPSTFTIITLDPSGGYRHWGGGAAIGRNAASVRQQLHQNLVAASLADSTTIAKNGASTLEICLRSSVEARREEATVNGELSDHYEALLLWEDEAKQFSVASIDPKQVREVRQAIQAE